MKKLTQFSVNYPVTVLMMVLAVLLLGYISFSKLGVDLFPELNNPRLYIQVDAGSRPPDEIENLFVRNIESQAVRQSEVVNVSSVTRVGSASVTVEYAWGKDMDEAFLELQKAISGYSQNSGIEAISITQYDPNSTPVMVVAIDNENLLNLDEVRKVAENYIRNELIRIEGIADVVLAGEELAEVVVETDPYLLQAYGLTTGDISQRIQNYNRNVSGGTIEENGMSYSIRGVGMIQTHSDLERIVVGMKEVELPDGTSTTTPVYLADVANISVANKEPLTIVNLDGKRSIGLSVYKEPRYNTVKAVSQLNEAFETISKALPGYSFTTVKNQGQFISSAIKEVRQSAIMGIILAIIVLFVFLRRIKTTLVISIAIPISIVATFALMYFRGLTLNVMTLGGLALGAGMLIDNAIIVMENISRHIERGKSVWQSAIDGTAEVGGAITASTLTTVVVFLPIVYLQGASGELFKDQAWTVAFSLLSSLLVAILVIPVLVTKIMGKKSTLKPVKTVKFKWYAAYIETMLKRKAIIIIASVVLVALSVLMLPKIGTEFMPRSSSGNITVEFTLPEGTPLNSTASTIAGVEEILNEMLAGEIESIYTQTGAVSTSAGGSAIKSENSAVMFISLTPSGIKNYGLVSETLSNILGVNPDVQFTFVQEEGSLQSMLGDNEPPLVVEIIGPELDLISDIVRQVQEVVLKTHGLYNVESTIEDGAPEINVQIDRQQAGYFNLSIEQIVSQLRDRLDGVVAGQYETGGEMRDITIRQPKVSLSELELIEIVSGNNRHRLSDLASISVEELPREIHRTNQNRVGKVSAFVAQNVVFEHVVRGLEEELLSLAIPNNYRIQMGGDEMKRKESMSGLTFALILSIVLVYMVMASQFESLIHPFTILLTIPLAMVGAVAVFYIIGKPLNIMAFIGMIMLAGIAVNGSIILVDLINQLRASGLDKKTAIVQATMQRARPIFMTSLTTILALLPLTFGFGESADLRSAMAWAVVGGLITSTLLTLVVIPCVYDLFTRDKQQVLKPAVDEQ